jgi:hypothetical protein
MSRRSHARAYRFWIAGKALVANLARNRLTVPASPGILAAPQITSLILRPSRENAVSEALRCPPGT